jgi:uncharacterized repeat protein (TIGR03806 family)
MRLLARINDDKFSEFWDSLAFHGKTRHHSLTGEPLHSLAAKGQDPMFYRFRYRGQGIAMSCAVLCALAVYTLVVSWFSISFDRRKIWLDKWSASSNRLEHRYGLPIADQPFTPYELVPAFGDLKFVDPVATAVIPDRPDAIAVAQRNGMIYAVRRRNGEFIREVYLDLRSRVFTQPNFAEEGLLGFAFHPDFAREGDATRQWVFVSYTAKVYDKLTHRVTRFEAPRHSSTIDDRTELVLIDQRYEARSHKGGCLTFGPDGFLYISLGDDDNAEKNAQRIDRNYFSGVLRIDVDQRGGEISHPIVNRPQDGNCQNYFVPSDNPFVGVPDALEEFYAIGFRNPWRLSFEEATGQLLVADVGDKLREEVHRIEKGDNGGWPFREGTVSIPSRKGSVSHGREVAPVHEYARIGFHLAIIGGHLYHGQAFPELTGKYIYADQSGRVYSVDLPPAAQVVNQQDARTGGSAGSAPSKAALMASLENAGVGVSSIGKDERGELLFCVIGELGAESGQVFRLASIQNQGLTQPPQRLSQTGLFTDLASLTPVEGFLPYEVVSPLWSDGAIKRRWISVPAGQQVQGKLRDRWRYPSGTVFIKHFEFPSASHPGGLRRVGTRYLIVDSEGKSHGATYRWNEEQTDADRVDLAQEAEFEIADDDGGKRDVKWSHPGRFDCRRCHNEAAGYVLGFNYKQLNRLVTDHERGIETGQLVRLRNLGILENTFRDSAPGELPRLAAIDDETAEVEHRLRSYLEVNCAPCHRPGLHYAGFDARLTTPLEITHLIGGEAFHAREGDVATQLVVPGDHVKSVLFDRMRSSAPDWRMPPLGRNQLDHQAIDLIQQWITSLPKAAGPGVGDSNPAEAKAAESVAERPGEVKH